MSATQKRIFDMGIPYYNTNADDCIESGTTGAGSVTPTRNVKSFTTAYGQAAFDIGKQYGIPYEAILAQAAHESGWGESKLTTEAYNFFGIKAGSGWTGPIYTAHTQEQREDGSVYTVNAEFRKYSSAAEGFAGYGEFITQNSRYATALKYPNNPNRYIEELKKAGYATDVQYVRKNQDLIAQFVKYISDNNLFPPSSEIEHDTTPPTASDDSSSSSSSCIGSSSAVGSGPTETIVQVALDELNKNGGVLEYNGTILDYTDGNREPWCADFVSWVMKTAGTPFTGGSSGGWRVPAVTSMQEWFKTGKNGSTYFAANSSTRPKAGDVAIYIGAQTPDGGSNQHVAIVVAVDESAGTITTVGGNESDTVKKSTRAATLGVSGLVGFGRMK
jgi:hypothetical protein